MPRLKNPNHEKLAKEYVKQAIKNEGQVVQTRVYQKVYPNATEDSARSTASALLAKDNIQERIRELIASKNTGEDLAVDLANLRQANKEVVDKFGNIIEVKDNATRLGAVNTCVKVLGGFGQEGSVTDARSVHFNMNNGTGILFDSMIKKLDSLCAGIMNVAQSSPSNDTDTTQLPSPTEGNTPH